MSTRAKPCGYDGCGAPGRLYPSGWRCPRHTPAVEAGRPEPLATRMENR